MTKFILFLIISICAPFSTASMADSELQILSHYEFVRLSQDNKIEYINALREVAEIIEEKQAQAGMSYETAKNENSIWMLLAEVVDAQTVAKEGATCVFAGGLSTYKKNGARLTCANNRPCKGNKTKIECIDMLHGENVCVPAGEHATRKCNQTSKISLEDLAKEIVETKRSEWDDYKAKLEAFCNPILQKGKKDLNLEACKEAKDRIDQLHTKIQAIPEKRKQVEGQPKMTTLKISTAAVNCDQQGAPAKYGCFTCPPVEFDKFERARKTEITSTQSKYGQLLEIMSKACGVANSDSASDGITAKSKEDLLKVFGSCSDSDFPGLNKFTSKDQEAKIKKLLSGDSKAINDLAGGLYYNDYSLALQEYFGLEIKEARYVFCREGKRTESIEFLKDKWPEFYLKSGDGNQESVANLIRKAEFMSNDAPLSTMPSYMNGNYRDNPLATLNKFKAAAVKRKQLAKCFEKGGTGSQAAPKVSYNLERRPWACTKKFTNVEYSGIATAINEFKGADRICVDSGGKSRSCSYDASTKILSCDEKPDESESTVSAYSCKRTAVNPLKPGESLVNPSGGSN